MFRKPNHQLKRVHLLIGFTLVCIAGVFLLPPIPQNPQYHNFADHRSWIGIQNCLNVISNIGFLIVGLLGLSSLLSSEGPTNSIRFLDNREKYPYFVFFIGVLFTGIGSAYYHWAPNNHNLVWDRLPMAISFMSLFSAMITERINLSVGVRMLPMLLVFGVFSVLYWYLGELNSWGDLRPYIIVQFYTTVAIPLIVILFPARYTRGGDIGIVVVLYGLAKLFELGDQLIYGQTAGIVSGHTLKHIVASTGAYWLYRILSVREPSSTFHLIVN